ncbi:MAG TPA: LacI family transcriptional regulator [Verrucomicrobiales bacterium]|nr:LacI family transcriptional regulator [Verrucomicrobiales bacterium]
MVRLKDIAARAGVSVMTVSKVMRDAKDISKETKARIRAMAREMGYVPDRMAQSLRSRTTKLLGIVISAATNPIFARVLMAIEEQAFEMGYDVIFSHTLKQVEREEEIIRRMISRRVDGLFIYPVYRMNPQAAVYAELERSGIPTVILGHGASFCSMFRNVETDDLAASQLLTEHLIQLGHRRIAFMTGPQFVPWSQERLDGYRAALREAQIEFDDRLIYQAGGTITEGEKAAAQMLDEKCDATAVQAVNDLVAIGAANTFLGQGLRIPGDLSIAGFGNILTAEHFRVPLTTVRQPKYRLGTVAMDVMRQLIAGGSPNSQRLPADIVVRQSTAKPAR